MVCCTILQMCCVLLGAISSCLLQGYGQMISTGTGLVTVQARLSMKKISHLNSLGLWLVRVLIFASPGRLLWPRFTTRLPAVSQNTVWPMYSQFDNKTAYRQFWEHEYTKHLVCAIGQVTRIHSVRSAFETVVTLQTNLSIYTALSEAGIRPSMQLVPVQNILSALQHKFGVLPQARCNGPNMQWLSTLLFCYDTELALIDCPSTSAVSREPVGDIPAFAVADVVCGEGLRVLYPPAG